MGLTTSHSSGFAVDDDFLYDKAHAPEPILFLSLLPQSVVVYFVHSVDQAYLKNFQEQNKVANPCLLDSEIPNSRIFIIVYCRGEIF